MIRFEKSVVINRPMETVFAFVTNMANVKLWLPVKEIKQLSEGPLRIGSTYEQTAVFVGQQLEATIQVSEYEVPRLFAFKTIESSLPMTTRLTFAAVNGNTEVTLLVEAEPPGSAMKLAGPLLVPMAKKQAETQVKKLKQVLEAQS